MNSPFRRRSQNGRCSPLTLALGRVPLPTTIDHALGGLELPLLVERLPVGRFGTALSGGTGEWWDGGRPVHHPLADGVIFELAEWAAAAI